MIEHVLVMAAGRGQRMGNLTRTRPKALLPIMGRPMIVRVMDCFYEAGIRRFTVVVGEHVQLSRVAVTHANLSVITTESPEVSQPGPFGGQGTTTVVPRTELNVVEEQRAINVLENATTVGELAAALNTLGVTPRDLSAIFQLLKDSGSLHAELEFK